MCTQLTGDSRHAQRLVGERKSERHQLRILQRAILIHVLFGGERTDCNICKFYKFQVCSTLYSLVEATFGHITLSIPRAKRAGPKGRRAESARAFTGRRNSHSGRGEDFLTGQPDFFTETDVTPERKVEKSFPRWEINRHAEG